MHQWTGNALVGSTITHMHMFFDDGHWDLDFLDDGRGYVFRTVTGPAAELDDVFFCFVTRGWTRCTGTPANPSSGSEKLRGLLCEAQFGVVWASLKFTGSLNSVSDKVR